MTSCVEESYSKLVALIPFEFPTGMIVGGALLRDSEFSNISTISSSGLYLKSTSVISFLVTPSTTTKLGFVKYPFPKDVIPIDLNPVNGVILNTCGNIASGFKVKSFG